MRHFLDRANFRCRWWPMRSIRIRFSALVFFLGALGALPIAQASPDLWYSQSPTGEARVHFYFFWTQSCPHCRTARPFVESLPERYPWLVLHSEELVSRAVAQRYATMAKAFGQSASSVPGFFFCDRMGVGFGSAEDTGKAIEAELQACHQALIERLASTAEKLAPPARQPLTAGRQGTAPDMALAGGSAAGMVTAVPELPWLGELNAQRFSLPVYTVILAGMDAFNPCAFFVLLFLLSLIVHARSRARMLFIGGVFVFFSGLIYFLFMAAWLNVFMWAGELRIVTLIAGAVAVVIAAISIKDFFWFQQGVTLSIPQGAKPGLYQRMRRLTLEQNMAGLVLGTITLAVVVNAYELLCTAGFPLVYTRVLTLAALPTSTYYLYLLLYNIVYILPLLAIVLVFTYTLGSRKLQEHEGRFLKLLSGLMMLGLGVLMLVAPERLHDVSSAFGILAAAVSIALVLRYRDRRRMLERVRE